MNFNTYETLALAGFVLLLGYFLVKRISLLKNYNIPEPVVGGFLVAIILTALYQGWGISFTFDTNLQTSMMLVFFSSIGLSANFARLIKGGKPLIIFVVAAGILIALQNTVGVAGSLLLGIDPAYGLIAGSVTLTGGHGTGAAWAKTFTETFGLQGATELAMHRDESPENEDNSDIQEAFEHPTFQRKINTRSLIETITMLACCLLIGQFLDAQTKGTALALPTFVWCLFTGVIIRNTLTHIFKFNVADAAVDVLGNVGLSLFLAIALMSLKLWQLAGLALPVMVILAVQVVLMAAFAIYVTYRMMGKDYDAVVLSAGHCGFGLGATPTAVANMQAITSRFGPSHKAFLIVPMVGAFFIDLVNAAVLKGFMVVVTFLH